MTEYSGSGWIGVDLDGTLAQYPDDDNPWPAIGTPIPSILARVKTWLKKGEPVRIFTARAFSDGTPEMDAFVDEQRAAIEKWCELHIGVPLPITCVKDFAMRILYDDRAKQVIPNRGETIEENLAFQLQVMRNLLIQYGSHTPTCAKRRCAGHACDCGFFAACIP